MKLFTIYQSEQLLKNGSTGYGEDHVPVVKLFLPGTNCTWLLTETNPEYTNHAFGLCDLGLGFPELGSVDLDELLSVRVKGVYAVERDLYFKAKYPISIYARAARQHDAIVEDETILAQFCK